MIASRGGVTSPPTPPTSGVRNASASSSIQAFRASAVAHGSTVTCGSAASISPIRAAEQVLAALEVVAAAQQQTREVRIGQSRDFRLERRAALGVVRLDAFELALFRQGVERRANQLVHRRARAGIDRGPAANRRDEGPARRIALAKDTRHAGAHRRFSAIETRGERGWTKHRVGSELRGLEAQRAQRLRAVRKARKGKCISSEPLSL